MKTIYKNNIQGLILGSCISLILFSSCKKFVEVDDPIDRSTTTEIFSDSASAENTVIGLYSQLVKVSNVATGFIYGNVSLYPALSAGEVTRTSVSAENDQFQNNNILSTNSLNGGNWNEAYNAVYQANIILKSLPESNMLSSGLKQRLSGEAKFLRALCYFYLTNEYGRVPLAISPDYKVNSMLTNSDTVLIYNQIISDLKDAQRDLSDDYPVKGTPDATLPIKNVRATKIVATALLARVYLYTKDYAAAAEQASTVISAPQFHLSSPDQTFVYTSPETILQFTPPPTAKAFPLTGEGIAFLPNLSTTRPPYVLSPELLSAFETRADGSSDLRRVNWVDTRVVSGISYIYPFKYKIKTVTSGIKTEYSIVLRLAEQHLIRAEALAQQGHLIDAITDLDAIRNRAGLPKIGDTNPDISKDDLLTAIYHENQIEFFAEWGHRWFDLKRTGRADAVLGALKGNAWQSTDVLYPIPYDDTQTAPNVKQNPGY